MSHKTVKAALVDRLTAGLPGYYTPDVWVAAADAMPADPSRWPFAIVRSSRRTEAIGTGDGRTVRATYRCEISAGVRSSQPGQDEARIESTDDRDDLIDAIRNTLRWQRGLGDQIRITSGNWQETTAPSVWEGSNGPAIALGTITFDVTAVETIPPPTTAPVEVNATTATAVIKPNSHNTGTL